MNHRLERVESQLKQELSLILMQKVQNPQFGLITVTGVRVSPDLKIARVYISVFNRESREEALEHIVGLTSLFRGMLAGRVKLRYTPELKFFIDDTLDYVEKIEGLLKKVHDADNQRNSQSDGN